MLVALQRTNYERACGSWQGTIASAEDVTPGPEIEWFRHRKLPFLVAEANRRGIKISWN